MQKILVTVPAPAQIQHLNAESKINSKDDFNETLLYVHQDQWQKDLLNRYGNNMTLLDATYKTTNYDLALFFSMCENKCWVLSCS